MPASKPTQLAIADVDSMSEPRAEHHVSHREHDDGRLNAAAIQNRRVMSSSSGFGSSSAVIVRGSSAMPQIGQAPGASRTISGCIGQV